MDSTRINMKSHGKQICPLAYNRMDWLFVGLLLNQKLDDLSGML